MLIYTLVESPRLTYIIDFIENTFFGFKTVITTDEQRFISFGSAKINYSNQPLCPNEFLIKPTTLLYQTNISPIVIDCFTCGDFKAFFKANNANYDFDIFAAIFYLLSRYEEYLPHHKDRYGRYDFAESVAYKEDFLKLPLINIWMEDFKNKLLQKFSSLSFNEKKFNWIPTYDIDIAYCYLHQSFKKNAGGFLKSLLKGQLSMVAERKNVLQKKKTDPFDLYLWLNILHEKYQLKPLYFFLIAEKRKKYDKNISPQSKAMQLLIKQQAAKYEIGIHPSWQSGDDDCVLKNEVVSLKNILGKEVKTSRQHYIRLKLPETYRQLIDKNIRNDYSMGYGSINGFRASVTCSFYWYDLDKEEKTTLLIHPFCYMDANSIFEQHFTTAQAAVELQQYHDIVKKVNGTFITIFHNHFITEQTQWIGWRKMYENFMLKNFS